MAASVHGVRDRVDGILTQLDRTDEEARAAAQGVADQFRLGTAELPHDQDEADEAERGRRRRRARRPAVGGPGRRGAEVAAAPSVDELSPASAPGRPSPSAEPAAEHRRPADAKEDAADE